MGFINHFPFFKLIHNGPLQSASMFFVTCLERRKKKKKKEGGGKGGWAVKSRLGSELLFTRGPEVSLKAGAPHKSAMLELGGEAQPDALAGLCAVHTFRAVTRDVNEN